MRAAAGTCGEVGAGDGLGLMTGVGGKAVGKGERVVVAGGAMGLRKEGVGCMERYCDVLFGREGVARIFSFWRRGMERVCECKREEER